MMTLLDNKTYSTYIIFTILIIIILWLPYCRILFGIPSYGDEGVIAHGAYRVYQGQIPYRDFFSFLTPGSFYWTALFIKLFGPSFLALRLCTIVTASLILILSCRILNQLNLKSLPPYLILLSFLSYFGGPYWFVVSHYWQAVALTLISLSILLSANNDKLHLFVLGGIFAALSALTVQHLGSAWILCASTIIYFSNNTKRLHNLGTFWIGILLIAVPIATVFIFLTGFDTLLYDLIIFPASQYHNHEAHQGIALKTLLQEWSIFPNLFSGASHSLDFLGIFASFLKLVCTTIVYALPFCTIGCIYLLLSKKPYLKSRLSYLSAFFVSLYLSSLSRMSDTTLVFASISSAIIIALTIHEFSYRNNHKLTLLKNTWLFLFFGLTFSTSALYLYSPKASIVTPAGIVQTVNQGDHQTLSGLADFFNNKTGSPVFIYRYGPIFYYLYHLENTTPYDWLGYPISTLDQLAETETILEKNDVNWVIVTEKLGQSSFDNYLRQNFFVVMKLKYAMVLGRKR